MDGFSARLGHKCPFPLALLEVQPGGDSHNSNPVVQAWEESEVGPARPACESELTEAENDRHGLSGVSHCWFPNQLGVFCCLPPWLSFFSSAVFPGCPSSCLPGPFSPSVCSKDLQLKIMDGFSFQYEF